MRTSMLLAALLLAVGQVQASILTLSMSGVVWKAETPGTPVGLGTRWSFVGEVNGAVPDSSFNWAYGGTYSSALTTGTLTYGSLVYSIAAGDVVVGNSGDDSYIGIQIYNNAIGTIVGPALGAKVKALDFNLFYRGANATFDNPKDLSASLLEAAGMSGFLLTSQSNVFSGAYLRFGDDLDTTYHLFGATDTVSAFVHVSEPPAFALVALAGVGLVIATRRRLARGETTVTSVPAVVAPFGLVALAS